jgi:ATP-binding cassette, subfamily B, bacterial
MMRYWKLYARYLKPLRPAVVLMALLIMVDIGLQIAGPQLISYFLDLVAAKAAIEQLILIALTFLLVSLLAQGIGVAATYMGEDIGWRATNQLRADLAEHCLNLDMSFHHTHTPGEMIERIDGDVTNVAKFFSQLVIRIMGNTVFLVCVLIVLALEDWRASLALVGYAAVGVIGLGYLRKITVPRWKATREANAALFGFIEEQLSGTEAIRSSGAVGYTMRNLFKFNRARMERELESSSRDALITIMWIGLYILGQAVSFILGYSLLRQGLITIGSVYLIVFYTHLVFQRLLDLAGDIQDLQQSMASIERVEALLNIESRIKPGAARITLPDAALAVVFDGVTFGYAEADPVLHNISLELPPGRVLGVLGRTGSGKTTLARLLLRLYDPDRGAIRVGAADRPDRPSICDIRDLSLDQLRRHVGVVSQNVQLFHATVRDNLTFFDAGVPDERILQVIDELGLSSWYAALSAGLDTVLEAGGSNLSAGEAQLLAFTRIFLNNPGLVILDEASSRLDRATENLIEQAIDRLLEQRTAIIIAHRLSTLRRADQIMIIENGQIQELGDYSELARNPASRFAQLLHTGLEEVLT